MTVMINRVVSLLVLLSLLAQQGVCRAHFHPGMQLGEPSDHEHHPHIHLNGGHHADRSHCDPLPPHVDAIASHHEHSDDVIYLSSLADLAQAKHKTSTPAPVSIWVATTDLEVVRSSLVKEHGSTNRPDGEVPIYLRALTLRL